MSGIKIEFIPEAGQMGAPGEMLIKELEDAKIITEILIKNEYSVNLRGWNLDQ